MHHWVKWYSVHRLSCRPILWATATAGNGNFKLIYWTICLSQTKIWSRGSARSLFFFIFFSVVCKGRLMHRLIKPGKMSAFGRQKMQKMPKSKYLSCTCREVLQLAFYYGNSFPNCHFRAHKKKGNIYMWVSVFVVVCRLFRWFAIEHCAHTHTHTFHHSTVVSVAAERISSGTQTPGLSPHLLHCLTAL